jgi:hypothetical protein
MKFAGIGFVVSLVLLTSGCGRGTPTHESLTQDMIGMMNEQADVLAAVKDEASANAAKPKLEALAEKAKAMKQAADKLGEPVKEVEEQLRKKFEPEMQKVAQRVMSEMMRIMSQPALKQALQDSLKKMQDAFKDTK